MGRRQGRTPPYEIMQHVGSGTPLPRSPVRKVRGGSVGPVGLIWAATRAVGGWLAGLGSIFAGWRDSWGPLNRLMSGDNDRESGGAFELRLPWPVLVLLGVVGLAAMGLMFQIGHHVAGKSGQTVVATTGPAEPALPSSAVGRDTAEVEDVPGTVVAMGSVPPAPAIPGQARTVALPVESPGGSGGIALTDPRAVGRNYFILATVRPSEVEGVRELQKFLAERGLETFLDTVNNGRLRVLVDVTRGFTREELRNLEHAEHEQLIRSLGREWKKAQGGIGTDLRDIYRDRYDGPTQ